jgi:hypothetical protein
MKIILPLLFVATFAFAQTPAQPGQNANGQTAQPAATNKQIWRCNLPAGTYEVAVPAIISVSSHEFIVDGAARVTEVNLDTAGTLTVRFYFIEPAVTSGPAGLGAATIGKVQSLVTEAAERSGTDAWKKVVKSYPTTTHARTVEYRVAKRETLSALYNSASTAFRTGRGSEFSVTE